MTTIEVSTVGVAQPRQRHRVVRRGGRAFAANYTPSRDPVNVYKAAVQAAWGAETTMPPTIAPVRLLVMFIFAKPKWRRRVANRGKQMEHYARPDIDNLLKSTCDALNGLAWLDDAQVSQVEAMKVWGAEDEQSRVIITIEKLDPIRP